MNAGESGITLVQPSNLDLTGATAVNFVILRPDGTTGGGPATVGTNTRTIIVNGRPQVFLANQYATYQTLISDCPVAGTYEVRLTADFGPAAPDPNHVHRIANPIPYVVGP